MRSFQKADAIPIRFNVLVKLIIIIQLMINGYYTK